MRVSRRTGVFETNSSSVHTFSIKSIGSIKDTMKLPAMTFHGGEFGWGPDIVDDWVEKTDYLVMLASSLGDGDLLNEIKDVLHEAGIEEVIFRPSGYVDHCEDKLPLVEFMKEDRQNLIDFIFGSGFILIDNDNGDYVVNQKAHGLEVAPNDYGWESLVESKYVFAL